jgi:anti-sigma regulatory factor (Ser/Thr protein kinase)
MGLRLDLARDVEAPCVARDMVEELGAELGWRMIDARIITTELVTNSIRHSDAPAERPIELEVELDADFVRIQVCDAGTGYQRGTVRPRRAGHDGGFGLNLVSALADAWGVSGNGGTCAWALLDRTRTPDGEAADTANVPAET